MNPGTLATGTRDDEEEEDVSPPPRLVKQTPVLDSSDG